MSYSVMIVGPAGRETWLCRGKEVRRENATKYAHPSAAETAMNAYAKKLVGQVVSLFVVSDV